MTRVGPFPKDRVINSSLQDHAVSAFPEMQVLDNHWNGQNASYATYPGIPVEGVGHQA
jgi:hypothetical protein